MNQMNYIKQLPALILFLAAGCASGEEKQSTTTPAATLPSTPAASTTMQPVQQPAAPAKGNVALNPAHGLPGHRCDIKVGEPLNSAPAAATAPQQAPVPVINPPAVTTSGAAKNPAHGMPGHRCDIAVGAPLNSKPVQ